MRIQGFRGNCDSQASWGCAPALPNCTQVVSLRQAAGNQKFFDPTIFQKCWRGVGEQPTFAEQIVFEIGYNYEPQAKKSFLLQQFFKNAGEVWASSPHLRSK